MATGQRAFGHGLLAEQLAARLKKHFADDKASASLAIGVFGEWGSGKSNLLQLIHEAFNGEAQQHSLPPVIVVPFNPWRYEKEDRLLVPLLKTIQREVLAYEEEHRSFLERLGWSAESPKRIANFFGISAMAFAKAFKFKGSIPGVAEVEFASKDYIEKVAEGSKEKKPAAGSLDSLESHYFDFEKKLRKLTKGKDGFRLLFLIDDLDRCLPEKAVEMLESIKLFLDVEGCAFVLAIDDEVVERGIIHRYKEYIFLGAQQDAGHKSLAQMPITGTEYLEKIIQLPFRLPLPAKHEVQAFLRQEFGELFGQAELGAKPLPELDQHEASTSRGGVDGEEMLKLFVNHIPLVPRKQRRAAELLSLQLDMAAARGCAATIKPLPLAKLILLQLFAPDLYRFGRRRHTGFMNNLQEWSTTFPDWGRNIKNFASSLENRINAYEGEKKAIELRLLDRLYKPLIEALEISAHSRGGFDPYRLISEMPFSSKDLLALDRYFSFVDKDVAMAAQQGAGPTTIVEAAGVCIGGATALAVGVALAQRPVTSLNNPGEFLDLLFSASEANWQSAVQLPEVFERVLDSKTFALVEGRLQQHEFADLLRHRRWLSKLLPLLNLQQFKQLVSQTEFSKLLAVDEWEESGHLLVAMQPEQREVFSAEVTKLQESLRILCQDEAHPVPLRALAGRLLGDTGWLPDDLDAMIKIEAGRFLRGKNKALFANPVGFNPLHA